MKPFFSIVIPAYNEEKYLGLCLESLTNQDFPKKDYEIIVVDNGSTDRTVKIAKKFKVHLIKEPKKGVVFARQKGFENAFGEIICSTDADCFIPPYWLKTIKKTFRNDPKLIALGGGFDIFEINSLLKLVIKIFSPFIFFVNPLVNNGGDFAGSNFAVKKWAFEKIGGFNTKLVACEDVEISNRLRKLGKVKFINNLKVKTSSRRFDQNFKETFKYFLNYFYLKSFNKSYLRQFKDIR